MPSFGMGKVYPFGFGSELGQQRRAHQHCDNRPVTPVIVTVRADSSSPVRAAASAGTLVSGCRPNPQGWIGADLDLRAGGFSAIRKREFSVVRFRVARDSPRTSTTLELHRGIIGLDQPACDWRTSMITRREFGTGFVVGALATSVGSVATAQQRPRKNTLMHVGGDYHSIFGGDITSKQNLEYNLRHGVRYLTAEMKNRPGKGWDSDQLKRMKDNCDRYGVVLEAFRMDSDYITLPNGAERDREIETVAGNIRKSAQIGVRIVTYHWELIPFRRNAKAAGRG